MDEKKQILIINYAGQSNATQNNTLIRKCPISSGDTSWTNAAGTNTSNSQWIVKPNNFWNDCYANDDTGWDLGAVTPVFKHWCDSLEQKYKD